MTQKPFIQKTKMFLTSIKSVKKLREDTKAMSLKALCDLWKNIGYFSNVFILDFTGNNGRPKTVKGTKWSHCV